MTKERIYDFINRYSLDNNSLYIELPVVTTGIEMEWYFSSGQVVGCLSFNNKVVEDKISLEDFGPFKSVVINNIEPYQFKDI